MEQKTIGSPLSRICYQDSTFMLEALLPFVPVNLKLPLAMLIKYNEFKRMLSVFHNAELLSKYGLTEQEFTMQGLARQLAGCPNPKLSESIGQMGQMMQMMQMMQAMQNMESTMSDSDASTDNSTSNEIIPMENTSPPLDTVISDILKQYDDSTDTKTSEPSEDPLEDFDPDQFVKEIFS